jgi:hypothetical protein
LLIHFIVKRSFIGSIYFISRRVAQLRRFVGNVSVKNDQMDVWDEAEEASGLNIADNGALRVALLFGSAAVAFALILTPFVDRGAGSVVASRGVATELDQTATGSISRSDEYTVRRSVLQSSPASVCVIRSNGGKSGVC